MDRPTHAEAGHTVAKILILDQSNRCRCKGLKFCTFVNKDEAGECMSRIMLSEVIEKLTQVIGNSAILEQMNNAPLPDGW